MFLNDSYFLVYNYNVNFKVLVYNFNVQFMTLLSKHKHKEMKKKAITRFNDIIETKLSYINESGKREQITIIGAVQLPLNDS